MAIAHDEEQRWCRWASSNSSSVMERLSGFSLVSSGVSPYLWLMRRMYAALTRTIWRDESMTSPRTLAVLCSMTLAWRLSLWSAAINAARCSSKSM
jgi:hypothetical protein